MIIEADYGSYIEIDYYEKNNTVYQGRTVTLYFDHGEYNGEEESITKNIIKRYVYFDIPDDKEIKNIRICFSNDNQLIGIDKLVIHEGIFDVMEFSGSQLQENGEFRNVIECDKEENHLWIQSDSGDSQYNFNDDVNNELISKLSSSKYELLSKITLLVSLVFVVILLFIGLNYNESLLQIILGISAFLVLYMALVSRPCTHPDESETKGAIDYYLTNWKLPNFLDSQFYNTFSPYGDTRLEDRSIYYILTGKFTYAFKYLFHFTGYYRLFGVFVFLLMIIIAAYWGKKNKAAFIPLILTPQVWYLFSYATSDAWDFFLCFVLTGELLIEDSLFNKALNITSKKKCFGLGLFGLISALIFMGKPNFYEVLLLAFIVLLFKLIYIDDKKDIIKKYAFVLLSFIICFGIRLCLDYHAYGFDKMKLYDEAKALHINEAKANYVSLKGQDHSLFEVISVDRFEPYNYKSFVGLYGKMEFQSGDFYYIIIGVLYIFILIELFLYLSSSNWRNRISYLCIALVIPLSYFISVYHSWTEDFQPQGRYIFPILFVIMYLVGRKNKLLERKEMKVVIPMIGCLGIYSYLAYGICVLT